MQIHRLRRSLSVACFYEMDTQVVIHADDCIDCMACVEVCPVHAIYADADVPTEYTKDIEFNALEANQIKDSGAPAITVRKDALPTANDRKKALGILSESGKQELRKDNQPQINADFHGSSALATAATATAICENRDRGNGAECSLINV